MQLLSTLMGLEVPANILLVDDRPENLVAIEAVLAGLGHNLVKATSGQEALKRLLDESFALVLLDVQMPGMDGYETAALLRSRERSRHTPIIFLTAIYKEDDHVNKGYSVGAVDYLFKPLDPVTLRAKVSRYVELSRSSEVLRSEVEQHRQASRELFMLNAALEGHVLERTAALEQANTELEAANTELAGRNALLARAQLERDAFLAMLSHELRNPLSVITTVARLLSELPPDDPKRSQYQGALSRQALNLRKLLDQLLDVARVTHGKIDLELAPVELVELVRRITEDFGLQRDYPVRLTCAAESLHLRADASRLEQVIVNLLSNAIDHGANGGTDVLVSRDADQAVIRVRDHGQGIAPELLPRIFDLFVQEERPAARSKGGLGIGLTVVRDLVRLHEGTVEARSEGPGMGSEFIVRLPLALAGEEAAVLRPLTRTGGGSLRFRRVLIVEDNSDAAESLAELLTLWGCETQVAGSGEEALRQVVEFRPELALLDIGLPGIDGYGLASQLRAMKSVQPLYLVALTGYGRDVDRERALSSGFDLHLRKPLEVERLESLLR